MNDRIRELAIEAGAGEWGDSVIPATLDIEKFAELIVNECIGVIDVGGEFVSRPKMVERVRSHFGVEE